MIVLLENLKKGLLKNRMNWNWENLFHPLSRVCLQYFVHDYKSFHIITKNLWAKCYTTTNGKNFELVGQNSLEKGCCSKKNRSIFNKCLEQKREYFKFLKNLGQPLPLPSSPVGHVDRNFPRRNYFSKMWCTRSQLQMTWCRSNFLSQVICVVDIILL